MIQVLRVIDATNWHRAKKRKIMKKLLTLILIAVAAGSCCAQALYTAEYYKTDPSKYLNKVVRVGIGAAKPSNFCPVKGYVSYHCFTRFLGREGGYIYVLVSEKRSRWFFRNYGTPKNGERLMKAKFTTLKWKDGNEQYVLILE